jgi:hypothetical protein
LEEEEMKHRHIIALALLFVFVLAAFPGCLFNGHSGRTHASRLDLESANHTDVYTHQLPDTAERFTLSIDIAVDAGAIGWTLTDPSGAVQWEGRMGAGEKVDQSRQFNLTAGEWTLAVELQSASGSYDIEFISR